MQLKHVLLLLLASSLIISGCATSLVYDPSLHLPARPMENAEVQAGAGIGYLLETRPDSADQMGDMGASFLLRTQLSKSVGLRVGHWFTFSSLESDGNYRGGLSADGLISLSDDGDVFLIPRTAMVFAEGFSGVSIEGGAFALQGGMTMELISMLRLYGGLGPVFGFRDLTNENNQWGVGGLLNAGVGLSITSRLGASAELSGVAYYNAFEEKAVAGISPSVMISYIF